MRGPGEAGNAPCPIPWRKPAGVPNFRLIMNLHRTSSEPGTDSSADRAGRARPAEARQEWLDRHLPARGFERTAFLALGALLLGLKVLAIYHFRADSDETQHASVVWSWVTGRLQYRDYFDNHMPLFQMACAPLMALFGERADIMVWLRWAMLPLYLVCLWAVYRLTDLLYSRRAAAWSALSAGAFWLFFLTSSEFRTDDLWAAFWLVSLVVAVSGQFTIKRAFGFGLVVGLAFAVSLKTVVLVLGLGTATAVAMALAWRRGDRPAVTPTAARLAAIVAGALIPPAATVSYFWWQGAYPIMDYCVIWHNVVPGLKRWGHFSLHLWYYPVSLAGLSVYGWLIFRQTADTRLAIRRAIVALTPWFFLFLLWSYWPDITREDDLPYTPLIPFSLVPLLMLAGAPARAGQWRRYFWTYGLPLVVLCECVATFKLKSLGKNRLRVTTHSIADVLAITDPRDFVMDNKGDYVFRRRADYWIYDVITRERMSKGTVQDDLVERLKATGTPLCYLFLMHKIQADSLFVLNNYMPFDEAALDLGVAGKELTSAGGTYSFDVAIPATYAIVSETGPTAGVLDGAPYLGAVRLAPGRHQFHRTSGQGRAAIFLDRALKAGFHPLFDFSEKIIKKQQAEASEEAAHTK